MSQRTVFAGDRSGERDGWFRPALSALVDAVRSDPDAEPTSRPETSEPDRVECPEETLYHLLLDNGGRMMQSELVEASSWSASRVSRRLKNLETAGWIRRVRQGRQNVVFVPAAA